MTKLKRSYSLSLKWDTSGFLTATVSLSRKPLVIDPGDIRLLDYFSAPRTLEEAHTAFASSYERENLKKKLESFQKGGLLVPDAPEPASEDLAPGSYAHISQHVTMLNDHVRVEAYRKAIEHTVKKGDLVVDLGCGTGILGIFALQAGAEKVYAIEESAILNVAREFYRVNGLEDRVTFFPGNSMNVTLTGPGDLLLSELMGTDPLAEGMLEVLMDAKKRFLKPGGRMVPMTIELYAQAAQASHFDFIRENRDSHIEGLKLFHRLFGIKAEPLAKRLLVEPFTPFTANLASALKKETNDGKGTHFLSGETLLEEIDIASYPHPYMQGTKSFTITGDGDMNAVVFFFNCTMAPGIMLGTSPHQEFSLNWGGQTIYLLPRPRKVNKGQVLNFNYYSGPLTSGRLRVIF